VSDEQALPPVIEAWVKQLLEPSFIELMRSQPYERVDVRLSASKGRVSRLPQIVLNGGQLEYIDAN
jgi:hypothetical protein